MEIFEKILTKKQYIFELANTLQITERKAEMLFNIVFDLILKELLKGKKVVFRDFGTFYLHILQPQTKTMPNHTKVETKKKVIVRFRSSKLLREKLTNRYQQLLIDKNN